MANKEHHPLISGDPLLEKPCLDDKEKNSSLIGRNEDSKEEDGRDEGGRPRIVHCVELKVLGTKLSHTDREVFVTYVLEVRGHHTQW
jgi:hypothetical protein